MYECDWPWHGFAIDHCVFLLDLIGQLWGAADPAAIDIAVLMFWLVCKKIDVTPCKFEVYLK